MARSIQQLIALPVALAALLGLAAPVAAADAPVLAGTVVDAAGQPFPVESGILRMTAPDGGGIHAAQVSVGGDGAFAVEVMPWGTAATPAEVTISITGVVSETVETAGCTDQYAPVAEATFSVALESGGEPDPVALVAEQRLIGTVCGAGSSSGPTLPPSEVDPSSTAPTEAPAIAEPVTPAPSAAPAEVAAEPVADTGPPLALVAALALGAVALIAVGAWMARSRRSGA